MYPTQNKILAPPKPTIEKELIILKKWKHKHFKGWSKIPEKVQEKKINLLLQTINKKLKGTKLTIKFDKKVTSYYNPNNQTIYLNKISIITSLHEIAHHLFGESELAACRYSVWLFKETFPISFKKLIFKKHTLTK